MEKLQQQIMNEDPTYGDHEEHDSFTDMRELQNCPPCASSKKRVEEVTASLLGDLSQHTPFHKSRTQPFSRQPEQQQDTDGDFTDGDDHQASMRESFAYLPFEQPR